MVPIVGGYPRHLLPGCRSVVAVAVSEEKHPLFTLEERVNMLGLVLKDYPRVQIDHFQGLLVDYVESQGANIILRGLRALARGAAPEP